MRRLGALLVILLPLAPLSAQERLGTPFKRPKLEAGSDSNDARAYFVFATRALNRNAESAAQGFYWAARLDPGSADALYGLRIALLLRRPQLLKMYMEGGRRSRQNKDVRALDSLSLRASRFDPFLYRRYDHELILAYYRDLIRRDYPTASDVELNNYLTMSLERAEPETRGWFAYSEGRMPEAVLYYGQAIKNSKTPAGLRVDKGRAHFMQGHLVPALEEFRLALVDLQKEEKDPDESVIFYNSKALVEHGTGMMLYRMQQPDSAKAALGRAMTEDLAYFMAHVALGQLALLEKDSLTAVSELGLAAEVASDEPWVQHLYGNALVSVGQYADAVAPLKKAIALEPLYAAPHFALGKALDKTEELAGATAAFKRYLQLAPARESADRAHATQRLAAFGFTP